MPQQTVRQWVLLACVLTTLGSRETDTQPDARNWTADFGVEPGELVSTGRNPWFILEPGYQLILEGGDERLAITVLNETRRIDGVETRVVEERETDNGNLVEVSRNFFAISSKTNSIYYFGEEVDIYRNGVVTSHEGAWVSGENGARFGLMMPGLPLIRARYYQEVAPGVALDRAEVLSLSATVRTPAGEFRNCLEVRETTPLEFLARESKFYARGVGLLQDGGLKLVRHGPAS
jgi:hypothetical protein